MDVDRNDDELLLALLNSRPVVDGVEQDALADAWSGRAWLDRLGCAHTTAEWRSARDARDALRSVVLQEQPPTVLAPWLAEVAYVPSLTADGLQWRLTTPHGSTTAARAVLALLALGPAPAAGQSRLRPCANEECALFLLDRSKANTARWCSMAVCGNRMKARRHYDRVRGAGAD